MQAFSPSSFDSLSTFESNHTISYFDKDSVPFDGLLFTASIVVIDKATNKSLPIIAFEVTDLANYFVISSSDSSTTGGVLDDSGWMWFEAKRSIFARAFTMCMFLINWALTMGSVYITILVVALRKEKIDAAFLLLPVTIVLTVPTLRGLYVGSPPFGVYIGKFLVLRP